MHRQSRSTAFISVVIGGALAALFSGCAHELAFTPDSQVPTATMAGIGEGADPNTPRSPAAVCDQYLALLSPERLEAAKPRYGTDGQCWSGDSSQRRQCENECRGLTYSLIKSSLAQQEAEKKQQEDREVAADSEMAP